MKFKLMKYLKILHSGSPQVLSPPNPSELSVQQMSGPPLGTRTPSQYSLLSHIVPVNSHSTSSTSPHSSTPLLSLFMEGSLCLTKLSESTLGAAKTCSSLKQTNSGTSKGHISRRQELDIVSLSGEKESLN